MQSLFDLDRAKPVLRGVNWSFSTPASRGRSGLWLFDSRRHHWYPATFIPEIPYTLIEVLSKPGDVVYDPFAGIGTTLIQALQLGRSPIGTELSRVTVDYMRAVWTMLESDHSAAEFISRCATLKSRFDERRTYDPPRSLQASVEKLRPWYHPATFNELVYLLICERRETDPASKAALRVAMSATLKGTCAQDRGWGCIADNMLPKREQLRRKRNAVEMFHRKLAGIAKDIERFKGTLSSDTIQFIRSTPSEDRIFRHDIRSPAPIASASVDLIVTSPPYPNMTDYAFSQRLSYFWLAGNPSDDVASEIGARRKRTQNMSLLNYRTDMESATKSICNTLKVGGRACFVMPTFEGDKWNNTERKQVIQECMAVLLTYGLVCEQELTRTIPSKRRHHNQKWTTLEREHIYVYRKVK
jgi:hypothetical protein